MVSLLKRKKNEKTRKKKRVEQKNLCSHIIIGAAEYTGSVQGFRPSSREGSASLKCVKDCDYFSS